MISSEEGSMRRFSNTESIGGNASFHNGKVCVGVNFRFESTTGKIIEFTNEGNKLLSQGSFRLELPANKLDVEIHDPKKKKYPRIISYNITPQSIWGAGASADAVAVIKQSMKLYNQCCDALEHKRIFKW